MSYVPVTDEQRREMLRVCGVSSIDELFEDIPDLMAPPDDGFFAEEGLSELETLIQCEALAARNRPSLVSFLGGGFYDHFIPAAVDAIASRSEFYTAYTPYQPELSQGTLQVIYEYQTHICRLTGMDISNASLYDGGTAVFEACRVAVASAPSRRRIVVDRGVNPLYRDMLQALTANLGVDIAEAPVLRDGSMNRPCLRGMIDGGTAAVVLQNPNYFGIIDDHSDIVDKCREMGVMTIQSVYPVALPLIKTPAEQGFDIAVGEGQSLGMPLSFGGPYLGFIGARAELARRMPGRIVARAEDARGRPGFVLSLQAREQHIRREKATSNICTNEAMCALRAHAHLSLLGTEGLKEAASLCHDKAEYARWRIAGIESVRVTDSPVFNEFIVELPIDALECVRRMAERGFAAGIPVGQYFEGEIGIGSWEDALIGTNILLVAVTEKRTKWEIDDFVDNLRDVICLG